jgi:hypothetical protein
MERASIDGDFISGDVCKIVELENRGVGKSWSWKIMELENRRVGKS